MLMKIENLTARMVILRLNSGQSLFIGPGAVSGEIPDVEVKNNPMLNKLRDRRVIAVHPVEKTTKKQKQTKSRSKGGK